MIELRKRRIEDSMDQGAETPTLYQVLPEKRTAVGGAMMGSAHIYDVPPVSYLARPMPRGYKTVFMLNSAEHEFLIARNCLNAEK